MALLGLSKFSILNSLITSLVSKPNFLARPFHIRVTRRTGYGDRYKLFAIKKDSFKENYSLEDYGINLVDKEGRITVDTLIWNGLAKKSGFETRDVISEFKIENLERPNKAIVYPFTLLLLFGFGYLNYKRKTTS